MKQLLTNRQWNVDGNWYEPVKKLEQFPSVIRAEYVNQSSSAGDWDGIVFQKIKNKIYAIPFSQENNYPRSGFTLTTGDVVATLKSEGFDFNYAISMIMEFYYE